MPGYTNVAGVNDQHEFPPDVRSKLAASIELSGAIGSKAAVLRASTYAIPDGAADVYTATMTAGSNALTLSAFNPYLRASHVGKQIAVEGAGTPVTVKLRTALTASAQTATINVVALPVAVPAGKVTITEGGVAKTFYHGPAASGATSLTIAWSTIGQAYTTAADVIISTPLITTVQSISNGYTAQLADSAVTSVAGVGYVVGTDNTVALQAAIDAARAANLPLLIDGCYVTGAITLHSQSQIIGTSPCSLFPAGVSNLVSTLVLKAGANTSLLTSDAGSQGVVVRDLGFLGSSFAQTLPAPLVNVAPAPASRETAWDIRNTLAGWSSGNGYEIGTYNRGVHMHHIYAYRNSGHGVLFNGTDLTIDGLLAGSNLGAGAYLPGQTCTLSRGNIWDNLYGVFLGASSRYVTVETSYIDANRFHGLLLSGAVKNLILNNKFTPQGVAGTGAANAIHIQSSSAENLIAQNWIGKPPGAWGYLPLYGIFADVGTSYIDGGNYIAADGVATALKGGTGTFTTTASASTVTKADVGLGNVDNTSDAAKPISTAQATALAGKADLVAGFVPTSQIPALALNSAQVVASQTSMLALTTSQVQPGDLAIRTDGAGTFILTATDPTQLANWTRLNAPTDVVTSVNGQQGTVVLAAADVAAEPFGAAAAAQAAAISAAASDATNKDNILGLVLTGDPRNPSQVAAWPGANRCIYTRVTTGGISISKIGLEVGTASGNISVSVYRNSGSGRAANPGIRVATSGAVACPATGYQEVSLGASVVVNVGDWLAISCDNTTATFQRLANPNGAATIAGLLGRNETSHPGPATATTLLASSYAPVIVGVP